MLSCSVFDTNVSGCWAAPTLPASTRNLSQQARNAAADKASQVVSDKLDLVTKVVVDGLDNSLDLPGFLTEPLESMVYEFVCPFV